MISEYIYKLTENPYLVALIYLVVLFVVIKISVFILEKIILTASKKTKTDLDDIIVEKSNRPLTIIIFLIGLRLSIDKLPISEKLLSNINMAINSLAAIVVMYIIYTISNLIFQRSWKQLAKRTKTKPNDAMMQLTTGTLKVVLIFFGIMYVLNIWGVEIGPLLTGLGIGGIAVAFALQSSLSNVFSGVSIILDKSINVGDLVNLDGGASGKIIKIGLRATKIKTYDNEIVIVPNSKLADGYIHNVAQPEPKTRLVVPFSVAYGADVDKVKKLIMKEIKKVNGIESDPEPSIKFVEMADSSLNFKAYFFVKTFDIKLSALDEANTRIYNALNKAGIEIPFPQLDVNIKK